MNFFSRKTIQLLVAVLSLSPTIQAAEAQPNILWITSEDNSSHWIGCYGNKQSQTPRIDKLAKEGVLFENAYSNAPVCAVARATILMGAYSPTMGTQHMRSRHAIPSEYRPNVEYLREAGYYCTNNNKTDYNFKGNDNSYWDNSSGKAHYKKRPSGKPFFAIFNLSQTHESSLFKKEAAEPRRVKLQDVSLPPYLPDLPEIRKDYARYLDRVQAMDTAVGNVLDELEASGLAENTIVFYYADHGGILPRGKRYLEQTGVKVPLIVRIPEKFRHLAPFKVGDRISEPVSFVDLSPTLFSLVGINIPAQMQGRPFLGAKRVEPAADEMEFLYADRFDELFGMRRGLTDGKWKYIRNFNPDFPTAPYSFYQFGQPGWTAFQQAFEQGKLSGYHKAIWEAPGSSEQLYDLSADPWEMNNLATNPAHKEKLTTLRERLKATMKQVHDTGLVPEPMFQSLSKKLTLASQVQSDKFRIEDIADLAFIATEGDAKNIPRLKVAAASSDLTERYWGIVGMRLLGVKVANEADILFPLLKDSEAVIRTTAAQALYAMGKKEVAGNALIADVATQMNSAALLNLLNTLRRYELLDRLPKNWEKGKNMIEGSQDYIERFTKKMKD